MEMDSYPQRSSQDPRRSLEDPGAPINMTNWNIEENPVDQESSTPSVLEDHVAREEGTPALSGDSATETHCSVLNLVIDHTMAPPSPEFEPNEKEMVPILRIFGPILYPEDHKSPLQSACLFLHGAYPYMIARPVLAGMDGNPAMDSPWDSVTSVQRMTAIIQLALQDALYDMDQSLEKSRGSDGTNKSATSIIRRITVVTGRGFYTYCGGPVAPFIRVEYYCPADRWKIKRCLEQGIKDLPDAFHPDPESPEELLQFHCFEAHIPYTMQVFKDYNLAGAAYIHLNHSVKFRSAQTMPPKQTSCPVELDASVASILNVLDVIMDTQQDEEDFENPREIHWKAVPSLREIWSQERRRMKRILGDEAALHEGASSNSSATRSAVLGMQNLVAVTQGLENSFDRAAREILERHETRILDEDGAVGSKAAECARRDDSGKEKVENMLTPVDEDATKVLEMLEDVFGDESGSCGVVDTLSPSQSFHAFAHRRQRSQGIDEFELSQKMERGEAVIEDFPFETLEDAVDPETLIPYSPDEESSEDEEEAAIERNLATLASQPDGKETMEGSGSQRKVSRDEPWSFGERSSRSDSVVEQPGCRTMPSLAAKTSAKKEAPSSEEVPLSAKLGPVILEPMASPPSASELNSSLLGGQSIHPISTKLLSYTPFLAKYTGLRGGFATPDIRESIQPTLQAPTRKKVKKWTHCHREPNQQYLQQRSRGKNRTQFPHSNDGAKNCEANGRITSEKEAESSDQALKDDKPLDGVGDIGGRIQIEAGGQLKAKTRATQLSSQEKRSVIRSRADHLPCPVKLMSVEIHTQRRIGRTGAEDTNVIALTPDVEKDKVSAIVMVSGVDPGGGESLAFKERYALVVSNGDGQQKGRSQLLAEAGQLFRSMPSRTLEVEAPLRVECLSDEKQLLLRFASLVRQKDPDMMMSWDTQGAGLGYIVERGFAMAGENDQSRTNRIDMARLLGRMPNSSCVSRHQNRASLDDGDVQTSLFSSAFAGPSSSVPANPITDNKWKGSGLGGDWDDRVGAGVAASSIVKYHRFLHPHSNNTCRKGA